MADAARTGRAQSAAEAVAATGAAACVGAAAVAAVASWPVRLVMLALHECGSRRADSQATASTADGNKTEHTVDDAGDGAAQAAAAAVRSVVAVA